jgi:hypothetical protein
MGTVHVAHLPPLIKVDQKHHVIPEAGQPVGGRHGDDEGEDIVNEGVESLKSQMGGSITLVCWNPTLCDSQ